MMTAKLQSTAFRTALCFVASFAAAGTAPCQLVGARTEVLSEARAAEILGYLASDGLAGRDTPSPGLEEAALYLAWSFQKAGLRPAGARPGALDADWFHRYTLPGARLPTAQSTLQVDGATLRPEVDFRLWSAGRPYEGADLEFALLDGVSRRLRRSRNPSFVAVDALDPVWRQAAGDRVVLRRGVPGAAPVVLVRSGAIPGGQPVATSTESDAGSRAQLVVPAAPELDVPLKNVAGYVPGTERPDEFVLVTAHYDHVGVAPTTGDDDVFNGADDNATGTTAVLGLAEFFASRPQSRSLMFVGFSAEEKGLRGSAAFVADPPIPLEQIVAVVNIEMLGRPEREAEPFVWITGEGLSDLGSLSVPALARAGVEKTDFKMADQLFFASDNAPFARAGIVAHSFSAGTLHSDYHKVGDEFDRIRVPHLCGAVRGIAAVVEELARMEGKPAFTEAAQQRLSRRGR